MAENHKKIIIFCALLIVFFPSSLWCREIPTIRVAAFNYYPAIFLDTDSKVRGFYVDMLDEIASREQINFEYVFGSWDQGLERLRSGDVDLVTSAAYSEERSAFMDFGNQVLLTVWGELYVRQDSPPMSICELRDKTIAVMRQDHNALAFKEHLSKFDISSRFIEFSDFDEVFQAVSNGLVAGGVVNSLFGDAAGDKYRLQTSGIAFNPFDIYFATGKGRNPELLALLDRYLFTWRQDSSSVYYQARLKWGAVQDPEKIVPPWIIDLAILLVSLLGLGLAFIVLLRHRVSVATSNLKEREAMLQESNEMNRLLLNSTVEAIYGLDNDGTCTFCNAACVRMLGYQKPEQLIGRKMHEMIHHSYPDGKPMPIHECRLLRNNSKEIHENAVIWRADGTSFPVEYWSHPIFQDGKVLGIVASFIDITDRRRAEAEKEKLYLQLSQAQKMESVGRLAGGVAHDFNNMLTVIIGNIEMSMRYPAMDDAKHVMLHEALTAARRSAEITRQLLAFSRKQMAAPKVLDLNDTVQVGLKMIRRLIDEDIDLAWKPGAELWPVKIDPTQIDQVLLNLCANARDAIAGVGRITIATDNMTLVESDCAQHQELRPGYYVLLVVSDDGCGMDEVTLSHLFEPFFTTKKVGHGTGLGLATVYGVVEQNHGLIQVDSKPGRGTTFKIYLPRHDVPIESAPKEKKGPAIIRGNETVLLVEDETAMLKVVELTLKKWGYTVLAANTPAAAMRLAEEHRGQVDLLITDVVMPQMNGRELARKLKAGYPEIKHLFMSGYNDEIIAHQGMVDESVNFIEKPFSMEVLAAKIRDVLDCEG
ncbi:response regulator [Desulfurivibrio alkaliphilus]|uniref:histidine kinase n=1 Tax=Desulfurivibrio alkaliphilus (strain DSM 19089 / UNIQEM U267 / AHT2) TaxID=589865 RepID=D6Z199_DESAT|nr:transporter substrate-binding domain-containing protein [Desulfurivibrio alkaliphilus]ADH85354.1 PAS/PAC sensor hybrid histidine kinase [Desulfurivibrio alkaliphilus AHT 2]